MLERRGDTYPRQRQPARAETRNVREEADGGAFGRGRGTGYQAREDEDHAQALAHRAPEEELPAPDALDDEPGDGSEDGVDDHVDAAEEQRYVVRLVYRRLEQNRKIVDDCVEVFESVGVLDKGLFTPHCIR